MKSRSAAPTAPQAPPRSKEPSAQPPPTTIARELRVERRLPQAPDAERAFDAIDRKLGILQERIVALGHIGGADVAAIRAGEIQRPAIAVGHGRDIGMLAFAASRHASAMADSLTYPPLSLE